MLRNIDCLEFLRDVADQSVDLVLQDPPYFIAAAAWDKQWETEEAYLQWCDAWTRESLRVLKPGRMMVTWGTLKTDTFLKYILQTSKLPGLVRQNELIWEHNWGGRTKKNFARKHDYALCWSKGKDFLFNPVYIERKVAKNLRTGKPFEKGTVPTCVWPATNHTMSRDFVNWHPTVKNLSVVSRVIEAYSNPGDTVLDSFLGSGTTAVAAKRTGRFCIGAEKDPGYFQKLQGRLEKAVLPPT